MRIGGAAIDKDNDRLAVDAREHRCRVARKSATIRQPFHLRPFWQLCEEQALALSSEKRVRKFTAIRTDPFRPKAIGNQLFVDGVQRQVGLIVMRWRAAREDVPSNDTPN